MPASVIKPIMAAAFLSDPIVGARWLGLERADFARAATPARDSLRGQLMRSNSARFLDRMFCADQGFINCRRPWEVQSAALAASRASTAFYHSPVVGKKPRGRIPAEI